jgi:hypothetical protein
MEGNLYLNLLIRLPTLKDHLNTKGIRDMLSISLREYIITHAYRSLTPYGG